VQILFLACLASVNGFERSYTVIDTEGLDKRILEAHYSNLSYFRQRGLTKAIEERGGEVINAFKDAEPVFSESTRIRLRNYGIFFAVTYVPSLFGFPFVSFQLNVNMDFVQAAQLALLPSLFACLVKLAIERNIS
jgi:hypothetical protein